MNRLPDFLILGTQKGGTTSLYHFLAGHPGVAPPVQKEVHFFDLNYVHGPDWYRRQFPADSPGRITGEASPYYLFHPLAPERSRRLVPEARLIVLLRDPVARAYSHYHHVVRQGQEPLSFEEALDREEERLAGEIDRMRHDGTYRSFAHQKHSYRTRGLYAAQLRAWHRFFPAEQFLLLRSEDLFVSPAALWRRATTFLGLQETELPERKRYNDNSYPPLEPGTAARLRAFFAPHDRRLRQEFCTALHWENHP